MLIPFAVAQQARSGIPVARGPYVEPVSRHDLGRMDRTCPKCGALHWLNERVLKTGSTILHPLFGMCCSDGSIQLPEPPPPPELLERLFTAFTPEAQQFRQHIRQYNAALSFTSLGTQIDNSVNQGGGGPPVFKIHGELHHQIGSLLPPHGQTPVYAQLYILDSREALHHRMQRNSGLDPDVMYRLGGLISDTHRWAHVFKQANEVFQASNAEQVSLHLTVNQNQDSRRYNLPTSDEVAAVIPGDVSQGSSSRDIVLHRRSGSLSRVNEGSPMYESLQYPLFFIHGEEGYHYDLKMSPTNRRRLSRTDYTAYHIQQRRHEFSLLLHGGRLFQQYLVDMWAAADQNRLSYLRFNQSEIRATLYQGLSDAISSNIDLHNVGQRTVLPSSYTGGPRYMKQCLQDALALARFHKKIDLFITITCNPSWPEITRELLPGQTAADRPDLCARVFKMKKDALIDDLYKSGIFGKAVARVHTIEFQKRGLPHAHLLIFLEQGDKILTPDQVDSAVWAYWPNPQSQPILFDTVKRCMVHTCGNRCLENGKCSKGYPKPFQPDTTVNNEGYPLYARPDDGRSYEVRGNMVSNQWIVPYNPWLSAKYDCHINVECLASFSTLKYVNKYIHKGSDRTSLQVSKHVSCSHSFHMLSLQCTRSQTRTMKFSITSTVDLWALLKLPGGYSNFPSMNRYQMLFASRSISLVDTTSLSTLTSPLNV